jgi:hypothetical protein
MSKQVNGYLAEDGKFFETEAECARYEYWIELVRLCESHNIDPQNFFELLHEWNKEIRSYYYADDGCTEKRAKAKGRVSLSSETTEPLPRTDLDNQDATVRVETDAGVLELPLRGRIGVSDVRSGPRTEAVPPARTGFGS